MANLIDVAQNFSTTLNVAGGIDNSQTSGIVLTSVSGLPTTGGILCIDWAATFDSDVAEYIEYTGISGNTLTGVTRGVEGLSAKSHSNQATVVGVLSKANINRINEKLRGNDSVAISDPNDNEILETGYVADAVNEVTVTNAATGNAPSIAATGGDTNIDLKLIPKGSGALSVPAGTYEANVTDDDDIPNKKYVDDNAGSTDGWTASSDTWTYASASTFTIAGVDRTAIYTKGTRLKFTQTSVKYAVVVSSSFSTNTTVTIAVNTDYTIANAAITSPHYSYQINPQGYPDWFTFTPTLNDVTIGNGTNTGKYSIVGKQIRVRYKFTMGSTSSITGNPNYTLTNPVAPANTQPYEVGQTIGQDVGTAIYYGRTDSLSSNAMYLRSNAASPASWSSSVPFTWANTDFWAVSFDYQF
jgi:hypothetical protein